jgi:cytochrome c biogenesis protein CcmG/thiol:disulfide interchange protein DsbE
MNNRKILVFVPLLVFILLGVFLWVGLYLDPRELPSELAKNKRPVPQFSLPSVTDPERTLTEADLTGEVALLNVWATWCPTCKEEHDFLNMLALYGAPETYVLDAAGRIRYRHVGAVDADVWQTLQQVMASVEQESTQ